MRKKMRKIIEIAADCIDKHLTPFAGYKGGEEFFSLIGLACVIGASMMVDGITSIDEIGASVKSNFSQFEWTPINLLITTLIFRLVAYFFQVLIEKKDFEMNAVLTYAMGFVTSLNICIKLGGADFIREVSERLGVGKLFTVYAFGFFLSMLAVRGFEYFVCFAGEVSVYMIEKRRMTKNGGVE